MTTLFILTVKAVKKYTGSNVTLKEMPSKINKECLNVIWPKISCSEVLTDVCVPVPCQGVKRCCNVNGTKQQLPLTWFDIVSVLWLSMLECLSMY